MVIGESKAVTGLFLDLVLLVTIGAHGHTGGLGSEFGRRAMLVCGADVEDIVAAQALEPRIDIRRQHRACQIAEVFHPVDIGQGGGDENAALACVSHEFLPCFTICGHTHPRRDGRDS